jgi:hypothetical protein
MSLDLIPYQPLPFGLEENCTLPCNVGWLQKIQGSTDITSIQFAYSPCPTSYNEIIDGNMTGSGADWSPGGAWTFPDTRAVSPIGGAGYIRQNIYNAAGYYYQLTFTIVVNNGLMLLTFPDSTVVPYSASGTYTYTFDSDSKTYVMFFFNAPLGGSVSNVILQPILTRVHFSLSNLNGDLVSPVADASPFTTYSNGFLTLSFAWEDFPFPDGCYTLNVYDPCQCAQFGFVGDDLQSQAQWDVYAGDPSLIVITGGVMQASAIGTVSHYVKKIGILCRDVEYTITFTLTDMQGTDTFQIRAGGYNGTVYTTDGTYTETFTPTYPSDEPIDLRFIFELDITGLHFVLLTDLSLEATTPIATYTSVPFELKETFCECTVLVEACGDGNQFNMGFVGTGFKPSIRLEGIYRGSNYPTTKNSYEFSNGNKNTTYMRTRKAKSFLFGAPEYVLDFAALWLGFDNVYIDGVAKYCEDEEPPTPSYEEDMDFATVTYTFTDKQELTEKRPCSVGVPLGCNGDVDILDNFGKPIHETAGRTIQTG